MKALAALTLLFFATPTLADLTYVPKWTIKQDMACYDLEQAKLLVTLDSKLVLCDSYSKEISELKLSNEKLKEAASIKQEQLDTVQGLADSLTFQMNKCIDEKNDALAKADGGMSLVGIILISLGVLALGIGAGVAIGAASK